MAVTIDQIKNAMAIIAGAIETDRHGEKYWPIFERLERELAIRQDRETRLDAARAYDLAYDPTKKIKRPKTINPLYSELHKSWAVEDRAERLAATSGAKQRD